jgi:hypothetical protein
MAAVDEQHVVLAEAIEGVLRHRGHRGACRAVTQRVDVAARLRVDRMQPGV